MRNLIFARHCYQFKAKYLQDYSSLVLAKEGGKYIPATTNVSLNGIEKDNVQLIQKADAHLRAKIRGIVAANKKYDHGNEHCLLENLIGKKEQLICLASVVVDNEMLTLLSVDHVYREVFALGTDTGLDGPPQPPSLLLVGPEGSRKVIQPYFGAGPLGDFVFDGKALQTTEENDIEIASRGRPTADEKEAGDTLSKFLHLLHSRDYNAAVELYGGEYQTLHSWNPKDTGGNAALFKAGCEMNGLQCMELLHIFATLDRGAGKFESIVEFTRDGSTPWRPCTELGGAPPDTKLRYHIEKRASKFFVMDMPPYCQ